ncbi:MAG: hypothetical protein CMM93_08135 [Rickettsiales bacterium]|nr:hypothetical protein [Rickettsiales bacterium]
MNPLLFISATGLSAFLLMMVQPMMAKILLPYVGGAPATWITCMLFFQVLLLGGYAYAAVSSALFSPKRQLILHGALMFVALLLTLPLELRLPTSLSASDSPEGMLLLGLLFSVGFPYFILTANSSLIQRWFHAQSGRSPYFLFAISNFGSFAGVLSYPFLVEWLLPLSAQLISWSAGFVLLFCLFCLIFVGLKRQPQTEQTETLGRNIPLPLIGKVVFAGFVPSSLFLSVTLHITTDVASFPLIWMIPFALYLLSFTLVFSKHGARYTMIGQKLQFASVCILTFLSFSIYKSPLFMLIDFIGMGIIAVSCHGLAAQARPAPDRLTAFYFWLSVGGALGGLFNVAAPYLFNSIVEYPLVLLLSLFAIPRHEFGFDSFTRISKRAVIIGLSIFILIGGTYALLNPQEEIAETTETASSDYETLIETRNFFGVLRVTNADGLHDFTHGTTRHGLQHFNADDPLTITTYYSALEKLFAPLPDSFYARPFAVVGLGAGTLACIAKPGQAMDLFEINPGVADIATNRDFFTYLSDCPGEYDIHLIDGRLGLENPPHDTYNLIVIDAFSSDAIPLHLLTQEAMHSYVKALDPVDGILAIHITNRHFDLEQVVAKLAEDANLIPYYYHYDKTSDQGLDEIANWMILLPQASPYDFSDSGFDITRIHADQKTRLWTDDYTFVLPYMHWE